MRILGIDPGLRTTGFGVVDLDGQKLRYIASGTIRTDKSSKDFCPSVSKFCMTESMR